ncbi:restriction endonuclease [Candidatus Pacearchaeota archaeon CG10_big_fil_rev_8_21_14_0_10_32_42]|nr:MAG: restriction endonuclease [Candidatus Pacearchaeota archaeon CG10_big_fil_rev_8_21_14_0_10_32_42]
MNKLSYISLFSSAGVGCYGFSLESFDCVATNELIERRLEVQKSNNKCSSESGYILGDITQEDTKNKILSETKKWLQKNKQKNIDVLIATPPCQGMSIANHKKKDELSRNSLVIESINLVKKINPKFFIFENVRAFLTTSCTDNDGKEKPIKEAIEKNLSGKYNILYQVVNFKDFGVPSSRSRTLVIGVRKDIKDVTPYDIFPEEENEKTLREVISHLPSLENMGDISKNDIYHNFRNYDKRMLNWIKDLNEGENAFQNNGKKKPHRVVDGKIVYNQNKNGDKYSRCYFDKVGPCVHTRNDILASQNTIHPKDNRVFSIRELMIMMSIPETFKWSKFSKEELNNLSEEEKRNYLSKNEMNIRQSLGEAVPTLIFRKIANNIKEELSYKPLTLKEVDLVIKKNSLQNTDNLIKFVEDSKKKLKFQDLSKICELANSKRTDMSAYYTRQDVCFNIINDLPEPQEFKSLNILEPSVGAGNFIPLIIKKYKSVTEVNLDLVDIDKEAIKVLKVLLKSLDIPKNIKINFITDDFIFHNFNKKYDIVVGNPPFKKIQGEKILLFAYKDMMYNKDTNNIFSFFIEKALRISKYVALITPKSLLSAPEFNKTRELIEKKLILNITDYGESAFDVLIETISIVIKNADKNGDLIKIVSYITKDVRFAKQTYFMSKDFPYWIIYRDNFFDEVKEKLEFGVFNVFRDRQITKKITKNKGKYRVLKSRNLSKDGTIINIEGYDSYVDNLSKLAVAKFLNKDVVIVPNLSYYPRAGILPKNCIADGSLAILTPKNINQKITPKQLQYFATDEFEKFYKIARHYGTRSLNIDSNSVFFWGLLKDDRKY